MRSLGAVARGQALARRCRARPRAMMDRCRPRRARARRWPIGATPGRDRARAPLLEQQRHRSGAPNGERRARGCSAGPETGPGAFEAAGAGDKAVPELNSTMIPALASQQQIPALYREFLAQLAAKGFSGEIRTDYATRLIAATDNSVYQLVPVAVIYPRHEADVVLALTLAHQDTFRDIKLSPRGGGTGTN